MEPEERAVDAVCINNMELGIIIRIYYAFWGEGGGWFTTLPSIYTI
jgi:hypothetical protein